MMLVKQFLASVLSCALILVTSGCEVVANQEARAVLQPPIQPAQATPEQLQQLVAPIALYPDELVAQILAASTYPNPDCGSGTMAATEFQSQGRAIGQRGG